MKQSVRTNMEEQLQKIIPDGRAGAFNQALMELGATVCCAKWRGKVQRMSMGAVMSCKTGGKDHRTSEEK